MNFSQREAGRGVEFFLQRKGTVLRVKYQCGFSQRKGTEGRKRKGNGKRRRGRIFTYFFVHRATARCTKRVSILDNT